MAAPKVGLCNMVLISTFFVSFRDNSCQDLLQHDTIKVIHDLMPHADISRARRQTRTYAFLPAVS
jgi:hypothetical protein